MRARCAPGGEPPMNDALPLKFDPSGLVALNAIIAFMVLGSTCGWTRCAA
jgi:hypothetical protein